MGNSSKVGPSRAWFVLPSLFLIAALVLGGIGITSFVNFVRSDFRAYQPGASISVTKDGFTLYAENGTLRLGDLRCTATGPAGQTPLRAIVGRETLSNGQGTFIAIASSPADFPAGQYVLSCESASAGFDVPLYLGPRIDIAAVGRLAIFGIVAPLFLGFCSIVLFAVLVFLRYRSRRAAPAAV
jgi:hypothetical protein